MKFSKEGIPILPLDRKLLALEDCIHDGSYEDAMGHLCDLLEHCRLKFRTHDGMMYGCLKSVVAKYGKHPCPIEEDNG